MDKIIIIQKKIKLYLKKLKSLPEIKYLKIKINYESINKFNEYKRKNNYINNKIREILLIAIINNIIPNEYYLLSNKWKIIKLNINKYIKTIYKNKITNIKCIRKGGRKYKYDFCIIINKVNYFNIEFKFNCSKVSESPQFVSPMNPSKYLTSSYEEYYYDNYLNKLLKLFNLKIPNKSVYLKEIHSTKPKCMMEYQKKYYNGCKRSTKFTNNEKDIIFYNKCKELSKQSISNFICENELNLKKLSKYLQETQKNKYYMLFKNNMFFLENIDMNNYELISYKKDPKKSRYIVTTKTNNIIKILLRWKNGNGIAYPAFQIS